jgi:hypothetical protein
VGDSTRELDRDEDEVDEEDEEDELDEESIGDIGHSSSAECWFDFVHGSDDGAPKYVVLCDFNESNIIEAIFFVVVGDILECEFIIYLLKLKG